MHELVGYLAALLTTLSFFPQALRVIKTNDTKAISLKMYLMFVTGIFFWLIYGILIAKPAIIIANFITLILAGFILIKKIREK
jgi:MtN3 and saliva related transmembrane protein